MLSAGLVGLPNAGKSSLFNLLTAGRVEVGEYPFTTIDENVGVVPVPDPMLQQLAELLDPEEVTPAHFRLIDIAGLVEGASRGEGLGNRFLGHIREVDAIVHVLRCFADEGVAHVLGGVDPKRDAQIVETELLLADLELVERTIERRHKTWQQAPKESASERQLLEGALEHLEAGRSLGAVDLEAEQRSALMRLGLLTVRPRLVLLNVGDEGAELGETPSELAADLGIPAAAVVALPVALESELARLEPEDRALFRQEMGLAEGAVERVSRAVFELLDLIRFFTVVHGKLTAWPVPRHTGLAAAAGRIHSDMEAGFIRAEVCPADELLRYGSMSEVRERGELRTEGRDYEVRDGDVIEIRFRPPGG